ncbi:MAG: secretin N-terminal domain-containing protein [Pirellulaceae bacterium]
MKKSRKSGVSAHNIAKLAPRLATAIALLCSGASAIGQETQFRSLPNGSELRPLAPTHDSALRPVGYTAPVSPVTQYSLTGCDWREFEDRVVSCWLHEPSVNIRDEGKRVDVELPSAGAASFMTVDRENGQLTFSGKEQVAREWKQVVAILDRAKTQSPDKAIQIAPLPVMDQAVVVTAMKHLGAEVTDLGAYYASTTGVAEPGKVQEDQLPGQLPPGTRIIERTQDDQGQDRTGPVQVQVFPELNAIVLVGPPEAVARVRQTIEKLVGDAQTTAPQVERVPLVGANPGSTATTVQEVYDSIYADSLGSATVDGIQDPPGLLVIGRPEAIDKIKEIVKQYDFPTPTAEQGDTFRSIKLKYMSAIDAKQRVDQFLGSQPTTGFGGNTTSDLPVSTIADYRSNTLVVKGGKAYFDQIEKLLAELDVENSDAVNVVRVFPLKNTLATNMQPVLQAAINGQLNGAGTGSNSGGTQQQGFNQQQQGFGGVQQINPNTSQLKSPSLQLMTIDRDGNAISGGIMFDVRVNSNSTNNSLIVTGPKQAMPLIEELIRQIDQLPEIETQIKVFQIVNGDAESMLTMLQSLFAAQSATGGGGGQFGGGQQAQNGLQLPLQSGTALAGNSLANLRFSFDQGTNSIIVAGPIGDLEVVEALLVRLDAQAISQHQTVVIRLSNVPVQNVADTVNAWLDSRQADITGVDPRLNLDIRQSRRAVIVEAETNSNSVIVNALPEYMDEVVRVIQSLDRRPPVIKIKVLIAEVNLSMLEEIGIDMGVQDSLLFDRGIGSIGFPFNQSGLGNNSDAISLATRETLAGQGLSNLGTGRINSGLGYGGLVLSAGNESINLLLRALQDKQCAKILNKPHIMTIENQQARIQVGASVSRISGVTQSNFGITNDVSFEEIGTILQVNPRVGQDGMIIMEVDAQKSALGPEAQGYRFLSTTTAT